MSDSPYRVRGASAMRYGTHFIFDPIEAMTRIKAKYGPFVEFGFLSHLGRAGRRYVLAAGPEYNERVLGSPKTFRTSGLLPKGPAGSAQRRIRRGLVTMNGAEHAHYRKLVLPALRRDEIDKLAGRIAGIVEENIVTWPRAGQADLWPLVQRVAQAVAINTLFSVADDESDDAFKAAAFINEHIRMSGDIAVRCPLDIADSPYRRMLRHAERVEAYLTWWGKRHQGGQGGNGLFSRIVNAPDERGQPLPDALIASHALTLFGASYETCQTALAWTLILLAQHPEAAVSVLKEATSLNMDASLAKQVDGCKWLDAAVKESMRLLPPVPYQMREAVEPTELGGFLVEARTRVILSSFLTNRLDALYPEADRFLPERWFTITPNQYEYLVFSAGPRTCVGARFGSLFLKIAVAMILRRFRITIVPQARIDFRVSVTLSPRRGVPVSIAPQDGCFSRSSIAGQLAKYVSFEKLRGPAACGVRLATYAR
jgi:cytochrome P450